MNILMALLSLPCLCYNPVHVSTLRLTKARSVPLTCRYVGQKWKQMSSKESD